VFLLGQPTKQAMVRELTMKTSLGNKMSLFLWKRKKETFGQILV